MVIEEKPKIGQRVEVFYQGRWLKGILVEKYPVREPVLVGVNMDEKVHNESYLKGHGLTISNYSRLIRNLKDEIKPENKAL